MHSHGEDLRQITGDGELVRQLLDDYSQAPLEVADRALLDYAVKLTREPHQMVEGDVVALRQHGFSDRAILDATHVAGYFNHINRVADALGIDPEPEHPPRSAPPRSAPPRSAPPRSAPPRRREGAESV